MSRPENSKRPEITQQPLLRELSFGDALMEYDSPLLLVQQGGKISDGLSMAADLSDGLTQLCMRLHESINNGEIAYTAEVRALAFLSNTVCALTRSACYGLEAKEGAAT